MVKKKKEEHQERLLRQFSDNSPLGRITPEDLEDFEQEVELMLLEGFNLEDVSVRNVIKRMDGSLRD